MPRVTRARSAMLPRPRSVVDEVFARHALFKTDAPDQSDKLYTTYRYVRENDKDRLASVEYHEGHEDERRLVMIRYYDENGRLSDTAYFEGERGSEHRVR